MTTLVIAAVLAAVGYRVSLWLWPYTRCSRCEGTGRKGGSNAKRWGPCKKCGGSGRQERLGVRLFSRRD